MYVIKNGTIHTGTGEVLENYDILIEGKKIKKIEKNICEADAEIAMSADSRPGWQRGPPAWMCESRPFAPGFERARSRAFEVLRR